MDKEISTSPIKPVQSSKSILPVFILVATIIASVTSGCAYTAQNQSEELEEVASQEICEIELTYEDEPSCVCPEGYELKKVGGWGSCGGESGVYDCPEYDFECIKE